VARGSAARDATHRSTTLNTRHSFAPSGEQRLSVFADVALRCVDIALYRVFRLIDQRTRLLTRSHLVTSHVTFLLLGLRGTSMLGFACRVLDVLDGIFYVITLSTTLLN
jgi:hypothetical protein